MTGLPTELLTAGSTLVGASALLVGGLVLAATRSGRAALPVFLDLLLAAGLLRLAVADTWQAIAGAAGVIAVRKLAVSALAPPVPRQAPRPIAEQPDPHQ
jgi:hypothetical protein